MPQWLKDILPLITLVIGFLLSQWGQQWQEVRKFKRDFKLELWKKKAEDIREIKKLTMECTKILFDEKTIVLFTQETEEHPWNLGEKLRKQRKRFILALEVNSVGKHNLLSTFTIEFPNIHTSVQELLKNLEELYRQSQRSESLYAIVESYTLTVDSVASVHKACNDELNKMPEFKG
jgi:uncharacterized protein YeaO (DUF488 family)